MEIFLAILLFAIGAILVVKGADFFVDAASWISDVTGISKVVIGATVIAAATSGPELFVSLIAAMQGKTDMAIGNVVGSNIVNLGIGFSLIAICRPAKHNDNLFLTRGLVMIGSTILLVALALTGKISIFFGIVLILIYIAFTLINIRFDKTQTLAPNVPAEALESTEQNTQTLAEENIVSDSAGTVKPAAKKVKPYKKPTNRREIIINILKFVFGLAGIIGGSQLIVDNATVLALAMGVSEMFIGLTIVAVGTSLPEIMTTIVAIIKKEDNLGIGNIVGSNVFNGTVILAISAFAAQGGALTIPQDTLIDLPVSLVFMLIAIVPSAFNKKITRWQGIVLAALYVGYIVYLGVKG